MANSSDYAVNNNNYIGEVPLTSEAVVTRSHKHPVLYLFVIAIGDSTLLFVFVGSSEMVQLNGAE